MRRLAAARPTCVVAPPLAYGSSGEHAGFAGTLSIGQDALELRRWSSSAARRRETFARLLLVSAHGGNAEPVAARCDRLRAEGRDVLAVRRRAGTATRTPAAPRPRCMLALHPEPGAT